MVLMVSGFYLDGSLYWRFGASVVSPMGCSMCLICYNQVPT
jgi:hypothetical protein